MGRRHVIADWDATYDDPILLSKGEELWLTGKSADWDGYVWVWAKNEAGQEGWIPDNLAKDVDGKTFAKTEFSALELTCRQGEALHGTAEIHGWVLCKNSVGSVGWVPARNLTRFAKA
ncbi:SH3 domain-containing protein [Tateyamaria sp.]|uniref:SH3 domain-containing protein n=1 Tax=Tateyamaria sp. TaxID=1929288 RepID=UPI00329F4D38